MKSLITNLAVAAGLALASPSPAWAVDPEGVPVTIIVLDEAEAPVPTAVIRHPDEADRHRVNTETGAWTGSVLYLPDGTEIVFAKGMELTFEVSAPGFVTQRIVYTVRKRKNKATIQLSRMDFGLDDEEGVDPVIEFGRDKPIDGANTN